MRALLTSDTHFGYGSNTQAIHRRFWSKVAKEKPDVIFHAGDWTCNKQNQLNSTLKQLRQYIPDTPVYAVRGNHEFWQDMEDPHHKAITMGEMLARQAITFAKHNITLLDGTEVRLSGSVVVRGFDGWYNSVGSAARGTNDASRLPTMVESAPTEQWMNKRAWNQLNFLLNHTDPKDTVITITHFPASDDSPSWGNNRKWEEQLLETSDFLLTGHSHMAKDVVYSRSVDGTEVANCRHLNCGSDYDQPKYVIFEIE